MNNDSTPTAADQLPTSSATGDSGRNDVAPAPEPQAVQTLAQKRAHAQAKKKYEIVNGLMTNLDMIIYVELSVLYYMEYETHHHLPSIRGF